MTQSTQSLTVVVRLQTTTDHLTAATKVLADLIKPTRANPDCDEFRVLQDTNNQLQFTLIEQWHSIDAVKAHGASDYMQTFMAQKTLLFPVSNSEIVTEYQPQ